MQYIFVKYQAVEQLVMFKSNVTNKMENKTYFTNKTCQTTRLMIML